MKVLDATFIIDYLGGVRSTLEYLDAHSNEQFVIPVPALAEILVGEGNGPDGDPAGACRDLEWGEIYRVDERTAVTAAAIAAEIGPSGPSLDANDALIAAVGRELDAPVVSADRDLTHPETTRVVDVERY